MHIAVIGAGAIGSAIAAGLTGGQDAVTLIARGQRLAWLRDHPLALERDGKVTQVRIAVADWPDLARPVDLAILCTKTSDLPTALGALGPSLAPDAAVVTLQNGVEAPDQVAVALPQAAVVAGRVHGFFELAGQRLRHVGVAPTVALGGIDPAGRAAQGMVAAVLARAGFDCTISGDIRRDLWVKFMLAASLGGVAAALGIPAGQVCQTAGGEALLHQAASEIARLGQACGVVLDGGDVDRTIAFVRQFPANATTSLQRDLAAGLPSEYDALPGAVIRLAGQYGLPVPVFARLDRQLALGSGGSGEELTARIV